MSTVNNSNEITFQTVDGQMTSSFEKNESGVMTVSTDDSFDSLNKDRLQIQDSFGRWMNYLIIDSPGSTDDPTPESSVSTGQSYAREQIFNITEISPAWAFSTEETKVLSSHMCYLDTMVLYARRKMLSVMILALSKLDKTQAIISEKGSLITLRVFLLPFSFLKKQEKCVQYHFALIENNCFVRPDLT